MSYTVKHKKGGKWISLTLTFKNSAREYRRLLLREGYEVKGGTF